MFRKNNIDSNLSVTNIGHSTIFKGIIKSNQDSLRIDGVIEGDVFCENKVVVGKSGKVFGTIESKNLENNGLIEGQILVTESVLLQNESISNANITAPSFQVKEGAVFNGNLKMLGESKN